MVMRKISCIDGIGRLTELGTFSSKVSAVGNLKEALDYAYYELLDGMKSNVLSSLDVEYNFYGIFIRVSRRHGAKHMKFFRFSKDDYISLKDSLIQLSEEYAFTIKLSSFDGMRFMVSFKPNFSKNGKSVG